MSDVPRIVVIGAAAVDVKAQSLGPLVRRADVPGRVRVTLGGVARNVAKNLALLGTHVTMISPLGDDEFGRMIRDDVARAGVNVGHLLFTCEQRTAMWVGILDARGDMDVGVFGGEILAALTPEFIRERAEVIADADLIAVDGTVPRETMSTIVEIARVHARPLYLNPASVGYAHGVADRIRDFALVTGNALEVQVLTGQRIRGVEDAERAAQILIERGVERAIVTLGAEGIVYADACVSRHEPAEPTDVVDTTGAGDALAAMFILCHLQARSLDETLTRCLHAAAVTAACGESVSQRIGSGWGRGWRLEVGD